MGGNVVGIKQTLAPIRKVQPRSTPPITSVLCNESDFDIANLY
jgi:hypothetical protein